VECGIYILLAITETRTEMILHEIHTDQTVVDVFRCERRFVYDFADLGVTHCRMWVKVVTGI